jgi:hypothetical protein
VGAPRVLSGELTDLLDGHRLQPGPPDPARGLLDPMADKLLLTSGFVT